MTEWCCVLLSLQWVFMPLILLKICLDVSLALSRQLLRNVSK